MQDASRHLRFGRYACDTLRRELLVDGTAVRLGSRAFDVLCLLIEERHRCLGKAELLQRAWPGVVVEKNNLEVQIWALRKIVGAQTIVTIPGRGYRFAVPLDHDPAAVPPAAPLGQRTHLPETLAPMIDRADELAMLRAMLDDHRLLTVTGAGGIGKSLLSQHLVWAEREQRPQGVCWIELASLADPTLVAATVASALGLPLIGHDARRELAAATAPLNMLMVLDNAEHLIEEVAVVVSAMLEAGPALRIVVTSQAPLQLAQERVFRLRPLATPDKPLAVEEAARFGAVALFVDRVRALDTGFTLTGANVASVCAICRRLDGSALAIELAAARAPLLGVDRLAQSLDERLDLLTKGRRDAPLRQRTLRAALEWTHALLGLEQQILFRRLAVFAGGFMLEHAERVAGGQGLDRWQLLSALDVLIDHSLVDVIGDEPPRYRLLESPLALSRELLHASADEVRLREVHARVLCAHFVALAEDTNRGLVRPGAMMESLSSDLDNGRAAMAWALQRDPPTALALVAPLALVLGGTRTVECAALWRATESLIDERTPATSLLRWSTGAALFHLTGRDRSLARRHARVAAPLARQLNDRPRLARVLTVLATVQGAFDVAEQEAAMAELLALDSPGLPLQTRVHIAHAEFNYAYATGDLDRCAKVGQRWLELTAVPGWGYERSVALANVADLTLARGQATESARMGEELELQLRDSRHMRSLAFTRINLLTALLACGELAKARLVAARVWPMVAPWNLQPYWGVATSLLAALEGRSLESAGLQGYARAAFEAAGGSIEINEERALQRAEALAREDLGDAVFESTRTAGRSWNDETAGHAGREIRASIAVSQA